MGTSTVDDARSTMVEHIRTQARACADLGSPLYAELMDRAADDAAAGGAVADVLVGHEHDPGPSALGATAVRLRTPERARGAGARTRSVLPERVLGEIAPHGPPVTW